MVGLLSHCPGKPLGARFQLDRLQSCPKPRKKTPHLLPPDSCQGRRQDGKVKIRAARDRRG